VTVLGLGRSGLAAARLCLREGAVVTLNDNRPREAVVPAVTDLLAAGATLVAGEHPEELFRTSDLIVKSPGVKPQLPALQAARAAGVPVVGEVELCAPFLAASGAPVVGITGTNGKSTTTALTGHLLQAAGRHLFSGGNLGTPVAEAVLSGERFDVWVLELSSYQLDDLRALQLDLGAVLNVTPDHLDRYGTVEAYAASKAQLPARVRAGGALVLGDDNGWTHAMRAPAGVVERRFGASPDVDLRVVADGVERRAEEGGVEHYPVQVAALRGAHNRENAAVAIELARRLGLTPDEVRRGLESYPGLAHRIESVRRLGGVEWINDSKATNVDSVEKSLQAFAGPLHLMLGGLGKGAPYAPLRPLFAGRVCRIYTLGADAARVEAELGDLAPVERCGDLATAVARAHALAQPGETVLLSPACASFDQFKSFEHRGDTFRALVAALPEQAR